MVGVDVGQGLGSRERFMVIGIVSIEWNMMLWLGIKEGDVYYVLRGCLDH